MTTMTAQTTTRFEDKAAAALDVLEQAYAYYTPIPRTQAREEQPAEGYVPFYQAA